jgi:hypothetical protein
MQKAISNIPNRLTYKPKRGIIQENCCGIFQVIKEVGHVPLDAKDDIYKDA